MTFFRENDITQFSSLEETENIAEYKYFITIYTQ